MGSSIDRDEIEEKVLAYSLEDATSFLTVRDTVRFDFFKGSTNKSLYTDICAYYEQCGNIPTPKVLVLELRKRSATEQDVSARKSILLKIVKGKKVVSSELPWYTRMLRDLYQEGIYTNMVEDVVPLIRSHDLKGVHGYIRQALLNAEEAVVDKGREGLLRDATDSMWRGYEAIEADPFLAQGVLIGYKEFDGRTQGLQDGELAVVMGESGAGKSIFCVNIGVNSFKRYQKNVLFISLEINKAKVERRFISCYGYLPCTALRTGGLGAADKARLREVLDEIKDAPNDIYIVDVPRNCSTSLVEGKLKRVMDMFEVHLVIVDYMGIMRPSKEAGSDEQNQARTAEELHELARTYELPVVVPAQLTSRRYKSTAKEKGVHRVARSERIARNADIVWQIDSPVSDPSDPEQMYGEDESEFIIHAVKVRDEAKMTMHLRRNFARMTIMDPEEDYEEEEDFNDDQRSPTIVPKDNATGEELSGGKNNEEDQ